MKKLFLLSFFIAFISCSKNSAVTVELEQDFTINEISRLRINPESSVITSDEAINVVKFADMMSKTATKSASKQIADVITLSDEKGDPLIYAVNYADGQGYKLVSAIKDYYPILAMVDRGTFSDEVYKTGASVLLDEYINSIGNVDKLPNDVKEGFRKLWQQFEKRDNGIPVLTKLNEFDTFIVNTLQGWENDVNVHDFYNLSEAQTRLPSSLYASFCAAAEGMAHPAYDYMTYAYVVERVAGDDVNTGNYLLETLWHQEEPYNHSMEYLGMSNYQAVGCNAVALGQIMKYHQWPSTYPWSNIPNILPYIEGETNLSLLLKDIAEEIQLDNQPINNSNASNCYSALTNVYGYSCTISSHNRDLVINSIVNDRPVYMSGTSSSDGHAWVCDGFEDVRRQMVYTLYVIATSSDLEYVSACEPYFGEILSEGYYFHMNWGQQYSTNGWYLDGPYAMGNIVYNNDRIDITNIRKSN